MKRCWNCQNEISDTAAYCQHCEADISEEPNQREMEEVAGIMSTMHPDIITAMQDAVAESANAEEFVNRIMVGDCPECGSSDAIDCDNDPDIDDPSVGRCLSCGLLWCLDCEEIFKDAKSIEHDCPFWEELERQDDESDEFEV